MRSKSSVILLALLIGVTGMVIVRASNMGSSASGHIESLQIEDGETTVLFGPKELEGKFGKDFEKEIEAITEKSLETARVALEKATEEGDGEMDDLHESLQKLREGLKETFDVHINADISTGDDFVFIEQEFPIGDGGDLKIKISRGDVEIYTSNNDVASIIYQIEAPSEEKAREFFEKQNIRVSNSDDSIDIEGSGSRNYSWKDRTKATLKVIVPENFNVDTRTSGGDIELGNLEGRVKLVTSGGDIDVGNTSGDKLSVRTSGGDIETANIEFDDVEIETSGGSIELDRVESKRVIVRTSGGDIDVESVEGREIDIQTSGGDLELKSVDGPLKARTSGGDIVIDLEGSFPTLLRTSGGDIEIFADENLSADVNFSSTKVKIDSRLEFDGTKTKRKAEGKINGGGPEVTASTSGGSIRVRVK